MITRRAVKILRPFIALFYDSSHAADSAAHGRRARRARHARYVANATPARRLICFVACFGLILSSQPAVPASMVKSAKKPRARLTQGPPGLNLPDLNEARRMNPSVPKIATPASAASASKIGLSAPPPPSMQLDNWPMALIDQGNRVGTSDEDLLSRNFNWSAPIVSLPGRAGMGLNLGLSLNSLVWTKSGTNIYFNLDKGFPSSGFRLGLPELFGTIFNNTETGTESRIVIMPSGQRYEFRLNPAYSPDVVYEEMGSTRMLMTLKTNPLNSRDKTWTLLLTDGTAYKFKIIVNNPKCIEVKDRNGNYIGVTYTGFEQINTITDNMARVVNFKYDGSNRLTSITQNWAGGEHTYATFAYDNVTIQTFFPELTMVGVANGAIIPVLSRVDMADGKVYAFEYNTYAQVKTIKCYAPNSAAPGDFPGDYTLLSYIAYDLERGATQPQSDCPRFSSRRDWAKDWNDEGEAITTYGGDSATWGSARSPDGVVYKEFFGASGWQRGLTLRTETWLNDSLKKWTTSMWANDNANVSYWLNPRVVETNVYDDSNNRRRTTIDYADFGSVSDVKEYDAPPNTSTVLRHTHFEYLRGAAYTGNLKRRLTQLVTSQTVKDGDGALQSKVTYEYDRGGECLVHQGPPIKHDTTNFGLSFVQGRGNLNVVRRWDVTDPDEIDKSLVSTVGYNTSGSVIFSRDPLGHPASMTYDDSFSDSNNTRNTLAYPTTMTDADTKSSKVEYNYDFGAVTQTKNPKQAAVVRTYDLIGRLERVTNQVNSAYTRYVYAPDHLSVQSYTTVNDLSSEFYQITVFDGHSRARGKAAAHPGSAGGYKAQKYEYNVMGRLVRQTNQTEVDGAGEPSGDDAAGWVWSQQTYDWNGRPKVTTNQRGNINIVDYGGCACAGGEVVTIQDEGQVNIVGGVPTLQRRKTQIIHDALGREKKRMFYNWDGTVYASGTKTYNALDQVISVKQYKGDGDGANCPAATCQEGTMSYDGHGRLAARRRPQDDGNTTYTYYADDLLQTSTDARGATGTFTYNNRGLITGASYAVGGEVAVTPGVSFDYDELGNPKWMEDGPGKVDYNYDNLGRLMSETRRFDSLPGMSFQLSYDYNLTGEIKQVTDPRGDVLYYGYDSGGNLTSVTGSSFAGVTDYATGFQYRAWGQPKHLAYGDSFHAEIDYDAQMRMNSFNIPGLLGANYTINEDGRIRSAQSLTDSRLDRSFDWDHMGRIARSATTGNPGQFEQNYGYDVYGHMTSRSGWYWNTYNNYMSATYSRERAGSTSEHDDGPNPQTYGRNFQYDAMGNTTHVAKTLNGGVTETEHNLFDAMGRPRIDWNGTELDGSGRVVKENQTYNLISTPFGGQVLTVLNSGGQKTTGNVYVGTDLLAEQRFSSGQPGKVMWRHRDPMNTVARDTENGGLIRPLYMVDPEGAMLKPATTAEIDADRFQRDCHRQGGCNPPPPTFYDPNLRTLVSNPSPGQWASGCSSAFASASVSCGTQLSLFNGMSEDMLDGLRSYTENLIKAGFFNTAYSKGKPDKALVASSLAGVTASGIGGTYTLKLDVDYQWGGVDNDELLKKWVIRKVLVPGGEPDTTTHDPGQEPNIGTKKVNNFFGGGWGKCREVINAALKRKGKGGNVDSIIANATWNLVEGDNHPDWDKKLSDLGFTKDDFSDPSRLDITLGEYFNTPIINPNTRESSYPLGITNPRRNDGKGEVWISSRNNSQRGVYEFYTYFHEGGLHLGFGTHAQIVETFGIPEYYYIPTSKVKMTGHEARIDKWVVDERCGTDKSNLRVK